MIARMRRLREQREAEQARGGDRATRAQGNTERGRQHGAAHGPIEPRFHAGERVQCLPYGTGTVRGSRIDDERETVVIEFPDFGEIEVDPAVNMVRSIAPARDEASQDE